MRGVSKVGRRYVTRKDYGGNTYFFGSYANEECANGAILESLQEYETNHGMTLGISDAIKSKWRAIDKKTSNVPNCPAGVSLESGRYKVRRHKDGVVFSCGRYSSLEDACMVNSKITEIFDSGDYDPKTLADDIRLEYAYTNNNVTNIAKRRRVGSRYHVSARIRSIIQEKELKNGVGFATSLRYLGVLVYCGFWRTRRDAYLAQSKVKRYLKPIQNPDDIDQDVVKDIVTTVKKEVFDSNKLKNEILVEGDTVEILVSHRKHGTIKVLINKPDLRRILSSGNIVKFKGDVRLVVGSGGISIFKLLFDKHRDSLESINGNQYDLRRQNIILKSTKEPPEELVERTVLQKSLDSASILRHYLKYDNL